MKIKNKCGNIRNIRLEHFDILDPHLKKHSFLEIERVKDSIKEDGFLFPIIAAKLNGKMYVVDGETRLYALSGLKSEGYDIVEVPTLIIEVGSEEELKKAILIGTSTNHCVTKDSLTNFSEKTILKKLAFNGGELLDFIEIEDIIHLYDFPIVAKKPKKVKPLSGGLLSGGLS